MIGGRNNQDELTALRFVHNIYGSLITSPWTDLRELRLASGSLALELRSYVEN